MVIIIVFKLLKGCMIVNLFLDMLIFECFVFFIFFFRVEVIVFCVLIFFIVIILFF